MKNGKFKEEKWSPARLSRSEIFAALDLYQNCSLFEEEKVAFYVQSHLDKFSVRFEKTLQSKKQYTNIDTSLAPLQNCEDV